MIVSAQRYARPCVLTCADTSDAPEINSSLTC